MSSIRLKKTTSVFRCQIIRKQWKDQVKIHFGGSAVIVLWRNYRHQAIAIDSSVLIVMLTDAFLVLLFLLMGKYDGNILFSFLLSPKSSQNKIDWKQMSGYIILLFGLPARQWCLSQILSHRSLQQVLEVLLHYSRLHIANIDVHLNLKGIMIKFSLEEEKG